MSGPLEGVIVVDLTQQLAGPGGTMLLGDMGADVIRVDPPPERAIGDNPAALVPGEAFLRRVDLNVGRSKRSISLDLTTDAGREIVYALARRADVFAHNYRPGVAEKLRMDEASLRSVNADIVYSRVSAFGTKGPESHRAGFDIIAQAGAGSMVTTSDGAMPAPQSVPIGDVTCFCLEALAIVSALYHRKVTGQAQAVNTSMLGGAILQNIIRLISLEASDREWRDATMTGVRDMVAGGVPYSTVLEATATGIGGAPVVLPGLVNALTSTYYGVYRTTDGFVAVGCLNLRQQRRLNEVLDLDDPRFDQSLEPESIAAPENIARFEKMQARAERAFAERTTAQILALLEQGEIACAPVRNLLEVFDDEQALANGYVVEHDHPSAGATKLVGFPITFEKTPMRIARPAPPVGADSDEILRWLGHDDEAIAALRARSVVY